MEFLDGFNVTCLTDDENSALMSNRDLRDRSLTNLQATEILVLFPRHASHISHHHITICRYHTL